MTTTPLTDLYTKFVPATGAAPPDMQREVGQFDVFRLEDGQPGRPRLPLPDFHRQAFYKISLSRGPGRIEYADAVLDLAPNTLLLLTPHVTYRWLPHPAQAGFFCVFTADFLLPAKGGVVLDELPIFRPGARPLVTATEAESAAIEAIFQKMVQEMAADYAYKYDLLRTYLVELIHRVQKLQPTLGPLAAPTAAGRVAARFAELLDAQFAPGGPPASPRLRTAHDYADALAVHVNHLNRVLKQATGHTTTALLADRLAQEAKLLLKQPGPNVSEIADHLGFTDVAHFCTFFKRQTGLTPGDFRT
jgi:AraC-like DNA-binding protein